MSVRLSPAASANVGVSFGFPEPRAPRHRPSPPFAVGASINARSNSAASTVTIGLPCRVDVSAHVSASEQKPAPLSTIVARPGLQLAPLSGVSYT
jgi:hypothetical protein